MLTHLYSKNLSVHSAYQEEKRKCPEQREKYYIGYITYVYDTYFSCLTVNKIMVLKKDERMNKVWQIVLFDSSVFTKLRVLLFYFS